MAEDKFPMQMIVKDLSGGSTLFSAGDLIPLFFKGVDGISQIATYNLNILVPTKVSFSFEKLLGQQVTIVINRTNDKKDFFRGICSTLTEGESDEDGQHYHATIVSPMWLLMRRTRSRVFHDQAVPKILEEKVLKQFLESMKFALKMNLGGTYPTYDYATQYRESDFNFASRLMEEEGMNYFWDHTDSQSTMTVIDPANGNYPDINLGANLLFGHSGNKDSGGAKNRINSWEKCQQVQSNGFTLIDHHFEHQDPVFSSTQPLTGPQANAGTISHKLKLLPDDFTIADFPGEYCPRFDDVSMSGDASSNGISNIDSDKDRTTKIRIEQHAASSLLIHGTSTCPAFASGKTFELKDPAPKSVQGKYLLLSVTHTMTQAGPRSSRGSHTHYTNSFTAIPFDKSLPYRAPRRAPRSSIVGTQTAIVVGLDSSKPDEILTDKFGRVKVKFHWNPNDPKGQDCSRWIRVGQLIAGNRWGASFWPRIGQEVIVSFLEGDPDQPIIVGSVYNAMQMPPYLGEGLDSKHTNNNQISGIKTNTTQGGVGYNELRFDDTKGKEQVFIHTERDFDLRAKNEARESIANNRHVTIGSEKDGKKVGDLREHIFQDRHTTIERNQVENVKGNLQLLVGGGEGDNGTFELVTKKDLKELVNGDQHLKVGGARNETLGGNQSLTVGGNQDEKVGMNHAMEAGMAIHIKAGMTMVLEAGMQLSLKVGGNFIDINPAGVFITGTMVMINSGGAAGSGTDANPTSAAEAKEAAPTLPDAADDSASGNKSKH